MIQKKKNVLTSEVEGDQEVPGDHPSFIEEKSSNFSKVPLEVAHLVHTDHGDLVPVVSDHMDPVISDLMDLVISDQETLDHMDQEILDRMDQEILDLMVPVDLDHTDQETLVPVDLARMDLAVILDHMVVLETKGLKEDLDLVVILDHMDQ